MQPVLAIVPVLVDLLGDLLGPEFSEDESDLIKALVTGIDTLELGILLNNK